MWLIPAYAAQNITEFSKKKTFNYMIISDFVVFFIFVAVVAVVGAVEHVLGVANTFLSGLEKNKNG